MQRYFWIQAGIFIVLILCDLFLIPVKPGYQGGNLSLFQFMARLSLGSGIWAIAAVVLAATVYIRSLSDLGALFVVAVIGAVIFYVVAFILDLMGPAPPIAGSGAMSAIFILLGLQIFAPIAAIQLVNRFSSSIGYFHAETVQLIPFYLIFTVWPGFVANSQLTGLYLMSVIAIVVLIIYGRWLDSKIRAA